MNLETAPEPQASHAFEDATDSDSVILPAGAYVIEMALARPIDPKLLAKGLLQIGFSDGDGAPPTLDASQHDRVTPADYPPEAAERLSVLQTSYVEWSIDDPAWNERVRFVGKLSESTVLQETDDVTWCRIGELAFDPFVDIKKAFVPYTLENQRTYDVRFLSRMKAHATRSRVLEALAIMGFRPVVIACLKKNMRLDRQSGTDCALWCGRVVWEGPKTVLTVEDPLSFEDVVEVKDGPEQQHGRNGASDPLDPLPGFVRGADRAESPRSDDRPVGE